MKNLQGDITKIMTSTGAVVANYYYDAYGEIISITNVDGEAITDALSVAFLNPLRYRGYVYDSDTGLYYLQSRYYDSTTKRFVNADVFADTATGVVGTNMFTYCINNPINREDASGFASYKNTVTKKSKNVYLVTTKTNCCFTTLTYKYKISSGVIQFVFAENYYWGVLWRSWAKTLAQAMYKAAKSISNSYLKGRAITGIHIELLVHWALSKVGIKPSSTNRADMGGCWGIGYDSNAWVFESASIISRVQRISIYNVWDSYSYLRSLSRYFY